MNNPPPVIVSIQGLSGIISSPPQTVSIVNVNTQSNIVSVDKVDTIIETNAMGPRGLTGSSEEEMKYSKRTNFTSDSTFYKGEAAPGSLSTSPVWRISYGTIGIDGDYSEIWANGSAEFIHVWADHLTYGYS